MINKPKNITSRQVVDELVHIFKTKKIGHTGTLDPIATGVLVVCIGKYTKIVDIITNYEKEYVATVSIGIETDTLDITGNVVKKSDIICSKEDIINTLNSFIGKYNQVVPKYSAIKINGKKLYEYARNNENISLPKREVEIKKIELLNYSDEKKEFKFKVLVSKGTYIRSLIKDIGDKLNIPMTMKDLERTKQGNFNIENCYTLAKIKNNNYKLLDILDILNYKVVTVTNLQLIKKITNGALIENIYDEEYIIFEINNEIKAIYKIYKKDNKFMKPYKMF